MTCPQDPCQITLTVLGMNQSNCILQLKVRSQRELYAHVYVWNYKNMFKEIINKLWTLKMLIIIPQKSPT
jgi:hypothetical protein